MELLHPPIEPLEVTEDTIKFVRLTTGMTHCPHCEKEMEVPEGNTILLDEFFTEEADGVDVSGEEHVQLECPNCNAVLGYLAVGAATGG